jgi:carbon monoxide dehydrogenase subunit G
VIDARSYRAAIVVEVGPIKARFNLIVEVTAEEPPARVLSVTRGEEGGRASMLSASNELVLEMTADGATDVKYVSDVAITGRLGKFGLGIMKKKSASLAERFEQAFRGHVEVAAAS